MSEQNNHQQVFNDINTILANNPTLMDAYKDLEPLILGLFNAQRMSIFQRRRQHQDLVARFKTGKETLEIKVPISPLSIAGYVALSQRSLIISNPYDTEELSAIHPRLRFADRFDKSSDFKTRNILCMPILNAGVMMGVMQIINKEQGPFTNRDMAIAKALTEVLGNKFRYELGGTKNPFDLLLHEELISEKALKDLQESSADMRQTVQRLMSE